MFGSEVVSVSIQRGMVFKYFNGSVWVPGQTFLTADGTSSWHYDNLTPSTGSYTVVAKAGRRGCDKQVIYSTVTFFFDNIVPNFYQPLSR